MDYNYDDSYDTQSIRSQGSDMYMSYNDMSLQDEKADEVNKTENILFNK